MTISSEFLAKGIVFAFAVLTYAVPGHTETARRDGFVHYRFFFFFFN